MMDARVRVDFVAAQHELERLDAVADKLMAYKPVPMLSAGRFSTYVNYMRRFYRPATEGGFKRVTGENHLVAATPRTNGISRSTWNDWAKRDRPVASGSHRRQLASA